MRDLAVAITVYNNENEVLKFVKGLKKQSIIDRIQLLVTCNACKDIETFKNKLLQVLPSALVFNPNKNLGYLNGCLYSVKKAGNTFSWVMVSNTDIEFKNDDFFEKALYSVPKDVWCIGPDIVLSANGAHQNPFLIKRPSKRRLQIWKIAYSNYPFFWLYFKLSELKPKVYQENTMHSGTVYAIHGSCFLIRKECANSIIASCDGIFMYGEELLVAEIVNQNRKKIYCNMSIGRIQKENQVTGNVDMKRKQKWFKDSIMYIDKIMMKHEK